MMFMRKTLALLLALILAFALVGCAEGEKSAIAPPSGPHFDKPPTFSSPEISSHATESDTIAMKAYKAVLKGDTEFFNIDAGEYMTIEGFVQSYFDSGSSSIIGGFALVDLDSDGTPEVVLGDQANGIDNYGFEVLHYQGETVYGHRFFYRDFQDLKEDGTFSFSSGAANSGFGAVTFTEKTYAVNPMAYSESMQDYSGNLVITYYVDGESSTANEFDEALKKQDEKRDAIWHSFTDDTVENLF